MSISAINAKNHIRGIVKQIQLGAVVSKVELDTPSGVVTSVVSTQTLECLGLRVGVEAVAVIKAIDVTLGKAV